MSSDDGDYEGSLAEDDVQNDGVHPDPSRAEGSEDSPDDTKNDEREGRFYGPDRFQETIQKSKFFDGKTAPACLERYLGSTRIYVIHDLWSFIDVAGSHFIDRGVSFVR